MLPPAHHLVKEAVVETVKNTLRPLRRRANMPRNTRPEYLDRLKV